LLPRRSTGYLHIHKGCKLASGQFLSHLNTASLRLQAPIRRSFASSSKTLLHSCLTSRLELRSTHATFQSPRFVFQTLQLGSVISVLGNSGTSRTFATAAVNYITVTSANFSEVIEKSKDTIILDCFANWCGPCKVLKPKLEQAIAQTNGTIKLAVMDIDETNDIAEKLQISAVPAVFAWKEGKIIDSFVGNLSQEELTKFVDRVKAKS